MITNYYMTTSTCWLKKSEVFAIMFAGDTLESKNKLVHIEDVPFKAMESMLRYVYTGNIHQKRKFSEYLDLMQAADKYQIPNLKADCESKMLAELAQS